MPHLHSVHGFFRLNTVNCALQASHGIFRHKEYPIRIGQWQNDYTSHANQNNMKLIFRADSSMVFLFTRFFRWRSLRPQKRHDTTHTDQTRYTVEFMKKIKNKSQAMCAQSNRFWEYHVIMNASKLNPFYTALFFLFIINFCFWRNNIQQPSSSHSFDFDFSLLSTYGSVAFVPLSFVCEKKLTQICKMSNSSVSVFVWVRVKRNDE